MEIKKPMTTDEVNKKYDPISFWRDIESETCSMSCVKCNNRIWFDGSWEDESTPKTFICPYCGQLHNHPLLNLIKKPEEEKNTGGLMGRKY